MATLRSDRGSAQRRMYLYRAEAWVASCECRCKARACENRNKAAFYHSECQNSGRVITANLCGYCAGLGWSGRASCLARATTCGSCARGRQIISTCASCCAKLRCRGTEAEPSGRTIASGKQETTKGCEKTLPTGTVLEDTGPHFSKREQTSHS